jgi:hypothetical protein
LPLRAGFRFGIDTISTGSRIRGRAPLRLAVSPPDSNSNPDDVVGAAAGTDPAEFRPPMLPLLLLLLLAASAAPAPARAGDPYAYYDWEVSYVSAQPLGVKQKVPSVLLLISLPSSRRNSGHRH